MGTYVFSRLADMFEFFRTDREYAARRGKQLSINPGYWGEKLQAQDRCDGYRKFSEDKFKSVVTERLRSWIRDRRDQSTPAERRDLWEAVSNDVLGVDGDSGGYRKQAAAHDFQYKVNDRLTFDFTDFWEADVEEYSFRFMWCCYALAWGIKQYDDAKAPSLIGAAA